MLLACQNKYATAICDISSAYLYSPIEEEFYVQPPVELFPQWKGKIMRLKKAMYGTLLVEVLQVPDGSNWFHCV
jgi:hypothetical protein